MQRNTTTALSVSRSLFLLLSLRSTLDSPHGPGESRQNHRSVTEDKLNAVVTSRPPTENSARAKDFSAPTGARRAVMKTSPPDAGDSLASVTRTERMDCDCALA